MIEQAKEKFFIGAPCQFKRNLYVYPPTVKEIIENEHSSIFIKLLTQSREEIEDELMKEDKNTKNFPTPFELILQRSKENVNYESIYKKAFYYFCHQEVSFLYDLHLIVIGKISEVVQNLQNIDDLIYINEADFFNFQNLIRLSVGEKAIELPNPNEHPKIREMKRKARYRDRIKAKQASKKGDGVSFFALLVSICCMGLGITPLNIGEMSYIAMKGIIAKYQEKEKYQLDIDSLLAGGSSKKIHPKYWIKNLEE